MTHPWSSKNVQAMTTQGDLARIFVLQVIPSFHFGEETQHAAAILFSDEDAEDWLQLAHPGWATIRFPVAVAEAASHSPLCPKGACTERATSVTVGGAGGRGGQGGGEGGGGGGGEGQANSASMPSWPVLDHASWPEGVCIWLQNDTSRSSPVRAQCTCSRLALFGNRRGKHCATVRWSILLHTSLANEKNLYSGFLGTC